MIEGPVEALPPATSATPETSPAPQGLEALGPLLPPPEDTPPAPPPQVIVPAPPPAAIEVPPTDQAPVLTELLRGVAWLGATGASVGLCLASAIWREFLPAYVASNQLSPEARRGVLLCMGVGAVLFVAGGFTRARFAKRGERVGTMLRTGLRLSPLAILGPLPPLLRVDAWAGHELTFVVLASAVTLAAIALFRQGSEQPPLLPGRVVRRVHAVQAWFVARPRLALAGAAVAAVFYAAYFATFTIINHYNVATSAFDLGIEENLVWNAAHLNWPPFRTTPLGGPMTHLGYHETYISYLIAIPYRLFPDARFLLVLQAVMIGFAALSLFVFARDKVGPWVACLLSWLYIFYPPLHGANLYDFHYQPLAIFFLFLFAHLIDKEKTWPAWACAVFTLLFREDMGVLMATICGFMALRGRRPARALGIAAVCLTHFVVLKMIIMPKFLNGFPAYINQYDQLLPTGEQSFGGVLKTVFANPSYTLTWLLQQEKVIYAAQILGPLAFLPLRRSLALLLMVPGFFFTLIQTNYPALTMISFQYTAYWVPFVFIAATEVLSDSKPRKVPALVGAMALGTFLHTLMFGAILRHDHARGAFDSNLHLSITPADQQRHTALYALIAQIPPDASVVAHERVVPHLTSRRDAFTLRDNLHDAEWILAAFPVGGIEQNNMREALKPDGAYGVVEIRDVFILAKRGHPKDQNSRARQLLGLGP